MNRRIIAALLGFVIICCCGCQNAGQTDSPSVLDTAQACYNRSDYAGTVSALSGLLTDQYLNQRAGKGLLSARAGISRARRTGYYPGRAGSKDDRSI